MKITFVGHASVLIEEGSVSMLGDPWLMGTAFNDSWSLYPSPVVTDDQWERINYIWISHEHPDHLSIPSIRSIPEERKKRIKVLFQKRYDTEVVSWLQKQGFQEVVELTHGKTYELGPDFKVSNHQIGHTDSAMLIKGKDRTVLNLNDCETPSSTLKRLVKKAGHVDVLLNQFSIAGWPGNPGDTEAHKEEADGVMDNFIRDFNIVNPDFVIPFASFVRFSHKESAFINAAMNTVDTVVEAMEKQGDAGKVVFMYPGDSWELDGQKYEHSQRAMDCYREDWHNLDKQPLTESEPVEMEKILETANKRLADMKAKFQGFVLKKAPSVTFYITDLERAIEVDLREGAKEVSLPEDQCVVSVSSQVAWYTFAMRFGLPTLGISGRFKINREEERFQSMKKLGAVYSAGFNTKGFPWLLFRGRTINFLWRRKRDLVPQFIKRFPEPEGGAFRQS